MTTRTLDISSFDQGSSVSLWTRLVTWFAKSAPNSTECTWADGARFM